MKGFVRLFAVSASCFVLACSLYGQPDGDAAVEPQSSKSASAPRFADNFCLGVKASFLGVGAEVAAKVTHRSNLRAGFNVLGYSRGFDKDGINYDGHLSFRTVEAHYDFFPWAKSFHVSGGMLAFIGNPITARASVPGGQTFTLGGTTYYGSSSSPASANGHIGFNKVATTATVGWGNLIRRDTKHISVPFEVGVAFQGSPKTALGLSGNVCTPYPEGTPGTTCANAATDSTVQSNIVSEQAKIDHSMRYFKVYPIVSVGFGYKF